jgi:hypothetical protein
VPIPTAVIQRVRRSKDGKITQITRGLPPPGASIRGSTSISERVKRIISDIDAHGNASLTRLTVLKKWFEQPGRRSAFGLWIVRRVAHSKGRMRGGADALLKEARAVLRKAGDGISQQLDREAAEKLLIGAQRFHAEFRNQRWGPVRIIHCWPVLLVEEGLALHLDQRATPSDGYQLVVDWTQNYDPDYGNGLNGSSREKLHDLVQFLAAVEAIEDKR